MQVLFKVPDLVYKISNDLLQGDFSYGVETNWQTYRNGLNKSHNGQQWKHNTNSQSLGGRVVTEFEF